MIITVFFMRFVLMNERLLSVIGFEINTFMANFAVGYKPELYEQSVNQP